MVVSSEPYLKKKVLAFLHPAPRSPGLRNLLAHSHWGLLNRFQTRSARYRFSEAFETVLTDLQ